MEGVLVLIPRRVTPRLWDWKTHKRRGLGLGPEMGGG